MTAASPFHLHPYPPIHPPENGFTIVPDDENELPVVTRSLWVGTSGSVALVTSKGDTLTLVNVQGEIRLAVRQVLDTGTTATNMVGLY